MPCPNQCCPTGPGHEDVRPPQSVSPDQPLSWLGGLWDGTNSWNLRPGAEKFTEDQPCKPFSDYKDIPFRLDIFYSYFPEFKGAEQYPPSFVAAAAKQAGHMLKPTWCRELDGPDRAYAFNLVVAHVTVLMKKQQGGLAGGSTPGTGVFTGVDSGPGVVTSASVGGVSVSKTQIAQVKNFWEEYFYQTPYGRTLLMILENSAPVGFYYEGGENPASWLRP